MFDIQVFPDGQQMLKIYGLPTIQANEVIIIRARFTWANLEIITQAVRYFQHYYPFNPIQLGLPYFLGARADRRFDTETVHYLKEVTGAAINSLNVGRVNVLDPHSDVLEGVVNNLHKDSPHFIVDRAITSTYGKDYQKFEKFLYVSPDGGARKKITTTVKHLLDTEDKILYCDKVRDVANGGKLTKVFVPNDDLMGSDCWIIDDICSYGGTFKNLARELKARNAGNVYLVVTHYEGTANTAELAEAGISKVFTTNSICDVEDPFVTQYKVI